MEPIYGVLIGIVLSFVFLWVMAGVIAQLCYMQRIHTVENGEKKFNPSFCPFLKKGPLIIWALTTTASLPEIN